MSVPYPKYSKQRHWNMLNVLLQKLEESSISVNLQLAHNGEILISANGAKIAHCFSDPNLAESIVKKAKNELQNHEEEFQKLIVNLEKFEPILSFAPAAGFPLYVTVNSNSSVRIYMNFIGEYNFSDEALVEDIITKAKTEIKSKMEELAT